eukprot:COSAG05_NODE_3450_length_2054_cov_6.089514_2_plen_74_part_00
MYDSRSCVILNAWCELESWRGVLDYGGCRSLYRLPCHVDHTVGVARRILLKIGSAACVKADGIHGETIAPRGA